MDHQPEAYKQKGPKPKPLVIRFLSHVKMIDGCFVWTGVKNNMGYGMLAIAHIPCLAHRVSYRLFVGEIKDGMVLDHLCRNRFCVNPAHLEQVTSKENTRRGISPCSENANKTECKRGHLFTKENTILVKNGRQCRACNKIRKSRKLGKAVV